VPSADFLVDVGGDAPPLIVVGDDERLVVLEGHTRLTRYALQPDALPPALTVCSAAHPASPSGRAGESAEEAARRDAGAVGGAEEGGIVARSPAHV
jgi:hypothetical protein